MTITAESKALAERKAIVWVARAVSYLVYAYLVVVEIILLIGFLLLLFGANPSAGFTQWAYRNLDRVMAPFRGIFTPIQLGTTGGDIESVLDTSIVFAMIIYGIVALALSALIGWLSDRLRQFHDAEQELQRRADAEAAATAARVAADHAMTQPFTATGGVATTGPSPTVPTSVPPGAANPPVD